jgi:hypothetical protein
VIDAVLLIDDERIVAIVPRGETRYPRRSRGSASQIAGSFRI